MSATDTPTPRNIDQLAKELIELQAIADDAADAVKAKKDDLLPIITRFGRAPDGAAKSLRLEGHEFELTATFAQSTSVNKKVVEELQQQIREDGTPSVFKKLFLTDTTYIVAADADTFLGRLSEKALALYRRCVKTTQRKPTVKAESKTAAKASA